MAFQKLSPKINTTNARHAKLEKKPEKRPKLDQNSVKKLHYKGCAPTKFKGVIDKILEAVDIFHCHIRTHQGRLPP